MYWPTTTRSDVGQCEAYLAGTFCNEPAVEARAAHHFRGSRNSCVPALRCSDPAGTWGQSQALHGRTGALRSAQRFLRVCANDRFVKGRSASPEWRLMADPAAISASGNPPANPRTERNCETER